MGGIKRILSSVGEGEGALGGRTAGLGDPLLVSPGGGQASSPTSLTRSSGLHWQLDRSPGRVGAGAPDTSPALI